jgi:hypothetical protein
MAQPTSPVLPGCEIDEAVIGKGQPQYLELPAIVTPDGQVLTRWVLNDDERARVAETGELWLSQHTFNQPFQPVVLSGLMPSVQINDNRAEISIQ